MQFEFIRESDDWKGVFPHKQWGERRWLFGYQKLSIFVFDSDRRLVIWRLQGMRFWRVAFPSITSIGRVLFHARKRVFSSWCVFFVVFIARSPRTGNHFFEQVRICQRVFHCLWELIILFVDHSDLPQLRSIVLDSYALAGNWDNSVDAVDGKPFNYEYSFTMRSTDITWEWTIDLPSLTEFRGAYDNMEYVGRVTSESEYAESVQCRYSLSDAWRNPVGQI